MKLEVGKHYKTRNGLRATCVADSLIGEQPCVVLLHWEVGDWVDTFTADGYRNLSHIENPWDIISEWVDKPQVNWSIIPPWFNWVAMDEDGEWFAFVLSPSIELGANWWGTSNSETIKAMLIPGYYAPKWTGDWKLSLVERPKV